MKKKNRTIASVVFGLIIGYVGIAHGQQVMAAWPFSAPVVEEADYIDTYAKQGDIVFEGTPTNKFFGWDGTTWIDFGGPANLAVASKTSNYTLVSTDDFILANANSAAFTLTLPAAASNNGKVFKIKKTDTTFNAVTIDGNASETIDGTTTTTLNTKGETLSIVSDGTNWQIIERRIPSEWQSYTPTLSGFDAGSINLFWRRVGTDIEVTGSFVVGAGVGASTAKVEFPNAVLAVDSTAVPTRSHKGLAAYHATSGQIWNLMADASNGYFTFGGATGSTNPDNDYNANAVASSGVKISVAGRVAISGWKP